MKYDIAASIVVFKNDRIILRKAIDSFLRTVLKVNLLVIDNSPTDDLRAICACENVEYIFNNNNLGFGAGHNIAIRKMSGRTKYSLIFNPDVYFEKGVLEKLFNFMERNDEIGLLMPKVLYPGGALQHLCRLLPTPMDLLIRKFDNKILRGLINLISKYELKFADCNKQMDVPYLSGCFMFIRTEVLKKIGSFDERFFIYFEDVDLSRRIHRLYRTVYYPQVEIYHGYERGSNKDTALFKHLIRSGVRYFNKWGWFFDKERRLINNQALENLRSVR
ncbi:MAG: glycosyltransferase family 2 protein [Candidatus Omnitrophica bacterium]|nr:glycosyltransferase family 2 protein [Candidatus Omnitrophota bacterium]